ncbi:MAG: ethylbenzene dehydrogenase-related protein [bacterium]|nr:ethylbenzene dehydrogenase-related protein [bacterium]
MKKKAIIFLIAISLVFAFILLLRWGFQHSRGTPVPITVDQKQLPQIKVQYYDKEINFQNGIDLPFWGSIANNEVELVHQVTALPWPRAFTPRVNIKTFHNAENIYFYLNWQDETENRELSAGHFSDACAVMFPLDEEVEKSMIMMGFMGRANIWHWQAVHDQQIWLKTDREKVYADFHYPFEQQETLAVSKQPPTTAVSDLMAVRVGTVTPKPTQEVTGRGIYTNGFWQVVLRRALQSSDSNDSSNFGFKKQLCAFAVWNGEYADRGGRKSISDWVELEILTRDNSN